MIEYKPSPHSLERSLLQKAVRRGYPELAEKVFRYLISQNDQTWLRKRLYIIAYEECWPYGNNLLARESEQKILQHYKTLAINVKNKNAAGLAGLASLYTNDNSIISNLTDQKTVKAVTTISNSIKESVKYWEWIEQQPNYDKHKIRIDKAKKDSIKASHPEEKAMFNASAYLSIKDLVPNIYELTVEKNEFPYWVAIDKHTTEGKEILTDVANKYDIIPYRLYQIAFYMEGSQCNKIFDSPFWELSKKLDLKYRGYSIQEAQDAWNKVRPEIISKSDHFVREMLDRINSVEDKNEDQMSMF